MILVKENNLNKSRTWNLKFTKTKYGEQRKRLSLSVHSLYLYSLTKTVFLILWTKKLYNLLVRMVKRAQVKLQPAEYESFYNNKKDWKEGGTEHY